MGLDHLTILDSSVGTSEGMGFTAHAKMGKFNRRHNSPVPEI